MSGICAVFSKRDPRLVVLPLRAISDGLSLSPLERSTWLTDGPVGIAVSSAFQTQQVHRTERVLLACDADLDNRHDLAALLSVEPDRPAALLARGYERMGVHLLDKLEGNFSFILWDSIDRRLIAAVDRFGVNRLAYYQDESVFLVASRVDALTRSGMVDLQINPQAVPNLLNFSYNLGPGTILAKVERIPPGVVLTVTDGRTSLKRYWDMRYCMTDTTDEDRLSKELETLVEHSVAADCGQDSFESVGAFLSGGTDSSTVVGMMSRLNKGRPKAFSIGFKEQPFNELGYAGIAAKQFGAEHITYLVGADDCFGALPDMVRSFDEPFGNSSAIPTYFCARLAAQHGVKVMLGGDGGDELFGGNERYATDRIFLRYHDVPAFVRKGIIEPVLEHVPLDGGVFRKARNYVRRANLPPVERALCFQFLSVHDPAEVFESDFLAALEGYSITERPQHYYDQAPARDHLDKILYIDVKITLGDSDLPKVTCMSELAGVQNRFPFLSRAVAEFSGRMPARLKVNGFEKRYLFKKAFQSLLPVEIIKKKKHGFGIPVALWLKTDPKLRELANDTLRSSRASSRGYFRRSFVEEMFRRHDADDTTFYGDTLWTFLVLELWHRQVVDQPLKVGA